MGFYEVGPNGAWAPLEEKSFSRKRLIIRAVYVGSDGLKAAIEIVVTANSYTGVDGIPDEIEERLPRRLDIAGNQATRIDMWVSPEKVWAFLGLASHRLENGPEDIKSIWRRHKELAYYYD
jgi:hypothetical protein